MNKLNLTRAQRLIPGVLFVGCVVFFLLQPTLDLKVSALFYDNGFYWKKNPVIHFIYLVFAKIHIPVLLLLIALSIYYAKKKQRNKKLAAVFLMCSLILGPGILVNLILKDNSLGRPRPVHVQEFGGSDAYAPPFHYSGACQKNCSFVSGHASIGFYLMALYWLQRKRRWLFAGIGLGLAIGLTRIMQGGHFFSDVIFAGWAVYFTCVLLDKLILSRRSNETAPI
ncbi:phosphatase PAP2 family protein [Agaribacterium haliotis]|uniref:phosphatase PAP2 family protein n=1 Tax=Agaribacterium haliotis TaxID=2013869 RepID=UPI000BB5749E|nr:phosphatase PAP2 family protein [Agaribacterium haliotis]